MKDLTRTSSPRKKRIDGGLECKKEKEEGLRDIEGSVEVEGMKEGGRGTKEKEGIEVEKDAGGGKGEERNGERGGVQTPEVVANKGI